MTNEELIEMYASGNGPVFYDRVSWALSYLNMSGLVNKPRRGHYQVTEEGIKMLSSPEQVNEYIAQKIQNRNREKIESTQNNTLEQTLFTSDVINELTPSETIEISFQKIKSKIYNEIIDTINSKTPREFEKLVVALLQKMGYGGEIHNSGEVTQYSNDNGIDGIIKEDVLGFGRIYIQAKDIKEIIKLVNQH